MAGVEAIDALPYLERLSGGSGDSFTYVPDGETDRTRSIYDVVSSSV